MKISEDLTCLFSATVDEQSDSYVIEVPRAEVEEGFVDASRAHNIALLSTAAESAVDESDSTRSETDHEGDQQGPPVSVGEQRIVEIDEMGDQGDGLARVEHGFVVIVPETEVGERVRIQIGHINETVAFADVVERFKH
ncbi:TRAM domain-containing protein [Halohasta litorea]|uniref:TRAM domain-containing protein n=1 Tax=Halohasta litorea TaxID=869891 RepID=A0ABD6DCG1_9EURY|nr:TRAM domain-containing protein [Halohasta litorea]